ncbi:hypothetical protein [Chroococcus sp. FPU101]|uniref:hypothetical protein n=1 Tax=Chroococcus sp. FPU101 TaxID=1974212 RepID=UPI001A8FE896|nr:hypothetical protein [Chroococcus sp. FPU101]GFE67803.1 hypothetical protein CFPU101_04130 [Chroococcus sp. FPU101]
MSLILFIIALFVAATLFGWLMSVLRSALSIAFTIAIALLLLKFLFGIEPSEVLRPITRFVQSLGKELNLGQYTSGIDFAQLWYGATHFVKTSLQQLIGG